MEWMDWETKAAVLETLLPSWRLPTEEERKAFVIEMLGEDHCTDEKVNTVAEEQLRRPVAVPAACTGPHSGGSPLLKIGLLSPRCQPFVTPPVHPSRSSAPNDDLETRR